MKIPDYIQDEIEIYKYKRENGNCGIFTYSNILYLIRLAVMNNRITEEEAQQIRGILKNL